MGGNVVKKSNADSPGRGRITKVAAASSARLPAAKSRSSARSALAGRPGRVAARSGRATGRPGRLAVRSGPLAARSRRRPWWKWLLIGILLLFSLAVTALYAGALIADVSGRHWAAALDASRDAVPALVGWAALIIVCGTGGTAAAERMLSADSYAVVRKHKQEERDRESVRDAERRVQELAATLAGLAAARDQRDVRHRDVRHGEAGLDRAEADTRARLDQARQWLASAQAALAGSEQQVAAAQDQLATDFPEPADQPGPATGRPA